MLVKLIQSLSREEARAFKLLVQRIKSDQQRLTLQLFDLIRRHSGAPKTGWLTKQLYSEDTPGHRQRLYLLRAKLLRELKRSMLHHHFELDPEQKALNDFSLGKVLRKKGLYTEARELLQRCIREAEKQDLFEIKELAYKELLTLSSEDLSIDVPGLVTERGANLERLTFFQESQNSMAFALQRLRKSNFGEGGDDILEVIQGVMAGLAAHQDFFKSPKGRIRLFNLTSSLLLQQRAFPQLEVYLLNEHAHFTEQGLFSKSTHRTKIIMLIWLVNITFNNLKFEDSMAWCAELKQALDEFQGMHRDQFIANYHNSLVNNYMALGQLEAAQQLQERLADKDESEFSGNTAYLVNLNLAAVYFRRQKYRMALRQLTRIRNLNIYQQQEPFARLSLDLYELVLRFEQGDFDFLDERIGQVKKEWQAHWGDHPRAALFLAAIRAFTDRAFLGADPWQDPAVIALAAEPLDINFESREAIPYPLWLEMRRTGQSYQEIYQRLLNAKRAGDH